MGAGRYRSTDRSTFFVPAWTSIKGADGLFHFAGVSPGKVRLLAYIGGKQVVVGIATAPAKDLVLKVPEE